MEVITSSEMFVNIRTTRRYIPEDGNIHFCDLQHCYYIMPSYVVTQPPISECSSVLIFQELHPSAFTFHARTRVLIALCKAEDLSGDLIFKAPYAPLFSAIY
jgi:hypothetical protein